VNIQDQYCDGIFDGAPGLPRASRAHRIGRCPPYFDYCSYRHRCKQVCNGGPDTKNRQAHRTTRMKPLHVQLETQAPDSGGGWFLLSLRRRTCNHTPHSLAPPTDRQTDRQILCLPPHDHWLAACGLRPTMRYMVVKIPSRPASLKANPPACKTFCVWTVPAGAIRSSSSR
jgi:hypothetical protein